jgi:ABC-2 type transport system ATP-binding protein
MEPAIRTDRLTRDFGTLRALDSLTFDVLPGVVFGFLGPNGSGKTTTIRVLLGLIEPTAGAARVLGFDTIQAADRIRERTGALLEHTGLYERLSAEDNLEYYGRIARMPAADRRARIRELLTQADLWDRRREPVGRWSRGMKQKLAVARALLHRPSLVFLDEPTAGLDPVAAAAFRQDLAAMVKRDGITVFLTTHNLTEAEKLCGSVAVIRKGKLLAVGHPDDLRARARASTVATFVGRGFDSRMTSLLEANPSVAAVTTTASQLDVELRGDTEIAPLVALLVSAGAAIEEIRRPRATLEDLFLDLVDDRASSHGPSLPLPDPAVSSTQNARGFA